MDSIELLKLMLSNFLLDNFDIVSGKSDYTGQSGKSLAICSQANFHKIDLEMEDSLVISSYFVKLGYEGILNELKSFGLYPRKKYSF